MGTPRGGYGDMRTPKGVWGPLRGDMGLQDHKGDGMEIRGL